MLIRFAIDDEGNAYSLDEVMEWFYNEKLDEFAEFVGDDIDDYMEPEELGELGDREADELLWDMLPDDVQDDLIDDYLDDFLMENFDWYEMDTESEHIRAIH